MVAKKITAQKITAQEKDEKTGKPAPKYAWRELEDDLRRDLAIIGRVALSNEEVLNLPLPEDNGTLWPTGTLLRDDDGTLYEWREE